MITEYEIEHYIKTIPAMPKVVHEALSALNANDLTRCAKISAQDPALLAYVRDILRKPVYGFSGDMSEPTQLFGALGMLKARQLLGAYLIELLAPKEWQFFEFGDVMLRNLQCETIANWNKILEFTKCEQNDIAIIASLLPAGVVVCEKLFSTKRFYVETILKERHMDLNKILKNLTGKDFFDIIQIIAKKWEFSESAIRILGATFSANRSSLDEKELYYAKMLHTLFFYKLSRPPYIGAGLNSLFEFHPEFAEDVYEDFIKIIGYDQ